MDDQQLRFPIGKFQVPEEISQEDLRGYADTIESLSSKLTELLGGKEESVYLQKYRPGSWDVRQVLYHLTDSHMHSYIRFKWTLTESTPTIKAYNEKSWAELPVIYKTPIDVILEDLSMIQRRLAITIRNLSEEDMEKRFFHPENGKTYSLKVLSALYAWHTDHHLNHIRIALETPA